MKAEVVVSKIMYWMFRVLMLFMIVGIVFRFLGYKSSDNEITLKIMKESFSSISDVTFYTIGSGLLLLSFFIISITLTIIFIIKKNSMWLFSFLLFVMLSSSVLLAFIH